MPRRTAKPRKPAADTPVRLPRRNDIRDLFSFQLQRLAGLSTRIAALSIRPFEITPREWRAMAVLSYLKQAPLHELARHSGILKSQMSRTVSGLINRGLIERSTHPQDGPSVLLRLSRAGVRMTGQILSESRVRNDRMLTLLSAKERQLLSALIARVFKASFAHYTEIRKSAPPMDESNVSED
jgi:DNA-binding MarR family transcriptional regulator